MARRVKERQNWSGICAGTAMALVLIEPIPDENAPLGGPLKVGPLDGPGGGGSPNQGNQDQDQQRRAERDRPISEEHKNKRRKFKQSELSQMRWGAPDKDG